MLNYRGLDITADREDETDFYLFHPPDLLSYLLDFVVQHRLDPYRNRL
jgi:hypothetical protein